MKTKKKKKKKKEYTLLELVEQWTRCEIAARYGRMGGTGWQQFAKLLLDCTDAIREKAFGTSDLLVLDARWEVTEKKKKKVRTKKKRSKHK